MRKHKLLPCKPTMNSGLKEKKKFESSRAIKSKIGHMTWYREYRDSKNLHFARFHHWKYSYYMHINTLLTYGRKW
jgi:hypothetical protein